MNTEPRRRRRYAVAPPEPGGAGAWAAALVLAATALALTLMMGHRTPSTLTASLLVLVVGSVLAGLLARLPVRGALPAPGRNGLLLLGVMTAVVLVQIAPVRGLAVLFGPYPDALWFHPDVYLRHWSPDIGATLRGWAAFVALFTVAWIACHLRPGQRNVIWLLLVAAVVFQAAYGLVAHAAGANSIFGIWTRNNPQFVHGSFSNRNLFAAYLALLWPLAIAVWWIHGMPLLGRLPKELKVAGSLAVSAILAAALLASGSRLGSAAGIVGLIVGLLLWSRYRHVLRGHSVWPLYLVLGGALLAATWYGFLPLAERLVATDLEEGRIELLGIMLFEFPARWWLHGVGLGGFEAVFKQFQPAHLTAWYDYAHNDLLQWLLEMGVVGAALLVGVGVALWRAAHLTVERIALYSGLAALVLVGLGDFSWHIPATQIVLALFIGVLLRAERTPAGTDSLSGRY